MFVHGFWWFHKSGFIRILFYTFLDKIHYLSHGFIIFFRRPTPQTSWIKPESRTTALFRNAMWKAITKQLFRRIFSYGCRKNWYAGEWSKPVPMAKSAPTAATTALHRLSFAANAVKCSAESTGTIAAANPSSGAASAGWSQPGGNATQELSMRRYWRMW